MSSRSSGTCSNRSMRAQAPGTSIGNETNWMPIPSSVVVSHTFSIAAPMLNSE